MPGKSNDTNLNITIQEIYSKLCPKCQEKLHALVKDKLTDETIRKSLEGKE